MKKILSLGIVSLIALSTLSPFADASNDGRRMMGSGTTGSGKTVNIDCARDAVLAREASVKSAYTDLSSTLLQGLDTRSKELETAWSIENASNRRVSRDTAWNNWRTTSKTARNIFKTSRKSAWDTFRTSMKACNASTSEIDNGMIQAMEVQ